MTVQTCAEFDKCSEFYRYGMTETSPVVSKSKGAPLETVGYLVPNCHVRIVGCNDNNMGKNLGLNEVGEIFVRGPHVMKGYYNNQKATADCFEDDWLKTGDLGSFDKNGKPKIYNSVF